MQRETVIKSAGLGGASDLTLLAPLRRGFVDSLEAVSFKTRAKRVLTLLHQARRGAHEHAPARLLSDAVERVGVIHSVRVAVLEPQDQVLLAVTFDGPWEAYLRVLWDKVGTLLDLIFCNTEDYPLAWEQPFEAWLEWARRVQVETAFFYGPPAATAHDLVFLRRVQLMREHAAPSQPLALDELRAVWPGAEAATARLLDGAERLPDDPPLRPVAGMRMVRRRVEHGVAALAALYRLTDLHLPGSADGAVLRRAALELLREFVELRNSRMIDEALREQRGRFARALDWLFPDPRRVELRRVRPALAERYSVPAAVRADVQGGILRAPDGATHGALLLFAFDSARAAGGWIAAVEGALWRDEDEPAPGAVLRTVAFTPAGLRACGLDEDTVELLPEEFRQGMAQRAGMLGDVRHNHPRRWRLPPRWRGVDAAPGPEAVDVGAVHALLQLRCASDDPAALASDDISAAAHPLRAEVVRWAGAVAGARLLAVQPLRRRYLLRDGRAAVVEHFGYVDGEGQPDIEFDVTTPPANRIALGEVLWGHANAADPAAAADDPRRPWLHNGSFLVLRKYRQFPERLEAAVAATAAQMQQRLGGDPAQHAETVYAKLMGRWRDGTPLEPPLDPARRNDFDYADDPRGQRCPLHAHIRRAHPRHTPAGAERLPRIVRRGMSYGPARAAGPADRGLVFMAYVQSLGEQFEVVQRWLAGGNSTGSSSAVACPIVGLPDNGWPRRFRFEHARADGTPELFDVELDAPTPLFDDPAPPTELQWGLYLFAPSFAALARLRDAALGAAAGPPWRSADGLRRIEALERIADRDAAIDAWKAAVEDPAAIDRLDAAALWAALRAHRGGVLKTPYGTLVADRALAAHVFLDPRRHYSVCGQRARMQQGFGDIYLGLDAGADYDAQAEPMNGAIGALDFDAVYAAAHAGATRKLDAIVAEARQRAVDHGEPRWETSFEAREWIEDVVADLCEAWFGVGDDAAGLLARGGTDWGWQEGEPLRYPGHFTALSRHMFQPHPGPVPRDLGPRYGRALRTAVTAFVVRHRGRGGVPAAPDGRPAPLAQAAFAHFDSGRDADFVARQIVGVLMGFIPTIIGAVLNVLAEWRRDGRFEPLRCALDGRGDAASARAVLGAAMREAMCARPMPQLTWRTVVAAHRLRGSDGREVELAPGDRVVLALVSGTQQSLADGRPDVELMFGGARSAAPHPTHACPGYEAGVAAMLGSLAALLGRAELLREAPGASSYSVEGPTGVSAPAPAAAPTLFGVAPMAGALSGPAADRLAGRSLWTGPAPRSRSGLVLAWGDSWLAYEFLDLAAFGLDLRDWLEHFGYRVPKDFCTWSRWGKLQAMAEAPDDFCRFLDRALRAPVPPLAVLLSGGGNDSVRDALAAMINPRAAGVPVLDPDEVDAHLVRLRGWYDTVLDAIGRVLKQHGAEAGEAQVPVLLHGYDHPLPAGRGPWLYLAEARKWLHDPFVAKGYVDAAGAIDVTATAGAMRGLIDRLNALQIELQQAYGFVRHVDLRGTIAEHNPADPLAGWNDDMHPASDMFELMAARLADAIGG